MASRSSKVTAISVKRFYNKIRETLLLDFEKKENVKIYITGESCKNLFFDFFFKAREFEFCVLDPRGVGPLFDHIVKKLEGINNLEIHSVVDKGTTISFVLSEYPKSYQSIEVPVVLYMCQDEEGNYTEDLKVDALRRDFYCNANYIDVRIGSYSIEFELEDPLGEGKNDADSGLVRAIGDIKEKVKRDPSMILKAVRQSIHQNYSKINNIDVKTRLGLSWIPEFDEIPFEQLVDEFLDILLGMNAEEGIRFMHEFGILKRFMPEFEEAWGYNVCEKSQNLSLTDHLLSCLTVLRQCNYILLSEDGFGDSLIFAVLLHDISKYRYHVIDENTGQITYPDNEVESGKMAELIMTRLGFDKEAIEMTRKFILHQKDLRSFWDPDTLTYTGNEAITNTLLEKFKEEDIFPGILALIDVDNICRAPEYNMATQIGQFRRQIDTISKILEKRSSQFPKDDLWIQYLGTDNPIILESAKKALHRILWFQVGWQEASPEDLIRVYDSVFGGKEIRIALLRSSHKDGPPICNAELVVDQKKDRPFSTNETYVIHIPKVKECIYDKNFTIGKKLVKRSLRVVDGPEDELHIEAKYYPEVYLDLMSYNSANEIFKRVICLLEQLANIPGKLYYSVSGDRDGTVGHLKIDGQLVTII